MEKKENIKEYIKENEKKQDSTHIKESVDKDEDVNAYKDNIPNKKVLDENSISDVNWINLPKKNEINKTTPVLKILPDGYYMQEGRHFINKTTNKKFYSGLIDKDGNEAGEFIVEGLVDGVLSRIRISNWELVYKLSALVKYCKYNNLTLANQEIQFKRINSGSETAGNNWEVLVPSLNIKIVKQSNEVQKL